MKRKKIISDICCTFATCLAVTAMLTGCGKQEQTGNATKEVSLTIEEGVLTVGTHTGYSPLEYLDEEGNISGFDIDLANALSEEMGLKVDISECAWDAIFKNLDNNAFDIIISGVSYTEDRNNNYYLTDAYISNSLAVAVHEDSDIAGISDLKGKTVGVQLDTTADYMIQDMFGENEVNLAQYETIDYAFMALNQGKADCVCADYLVVAYYTANNEGYKIVEGFGNNEPFCMVVSKKNEELYKQVNEALKTLADNGTLKELSEKYFGADLTSIE